MPDNVDQLIDAATGATVDPYALPGASGESSFTVPEGGLEQQPGKLATMTVDGVETEPVPGQTYSGVVEITVDGSEGAELHSDIGVILQMIDLDKAQRVNQEIDGVTYSVYPGPWTEPYASYEEIELSASAEPT